MVRPRSNRTEFASVNDQHWNFRSNISQLERPVGTGEHSMGHENAGWGTPQSEEYCRAENRQHGVNFVQEGGRSGWNPAGFEVGSSSSRRDHSGWDSVPIEQCSAWDNSGSSENLTSHRRVTIHRQEVYITVTKQGAVVQTWIESKMDGRIFGLDVEWKPNFIKDAEENKISLLQISSESECLLVQMLFLDFIPQALRQFLMHPNIVFGGVGIDEDIKKLERQYHLFCKNAVALNEFAFFLFGNDYRKMSLKSLAKQFLGFEMKKSKSMACSNWARFNLSKDQIFYACQDAWVSCAILQKLQSTIR